MACLNLHSIDITEFWRSFVKDVVQANKSKCTCNTYVVRSKEVSLSSTDAELWEVGDEVTLPHSPHSNLSQLLSPKLCRKVR